MGVLIERFGTAEDTLVSKLVGEGSKKGSTFIGRLGDVVRRPPAWVAIAAGLCATGERGRRAALRGSACYLSAAAVHLPIKAVVGRRHPPGADRHQLGPFTSSFPSGHAASDLAFVFGAAQELPPVFVPLSACTLAVHWSLVRKRAHYPSDVLAGGALGIAVALALWKVWPPGHSVHEETPLVPSHVDGDRPRAESEGPTSGTALVPKDSEPVGHEQSYASDHGAEGRERETHHEQHHPENATADLALERGPGGVGRVVQDGHLVAPARRRRPTSVHGFGVDLPAVGCVEAQDGKPRPAADVPPCRPVAEVGDHSMRSQGDRLEATRGAKRPQPCARQNHPDKGEQHRDQEKWFHAPSAASDGRRQHKHPSGAGTAGGEIEG